MAFARSRSMSSHKTAGRFIWPFWRRGIQYSLQTTNVFIFDLRRRRKRSDDTPIIPHRRLDGNWNGVVSMSNGRRTLGLRFPPRLAGGRMNEAMPFLFW